MRRTLFAAIPAFALSAGLQGNISARAADYTIDPSHTHILFMVNHLGLSNMIGLFTDMAGTFSFDPAHVEASKIKTNGDIVRYLYPERIFQIHHELHAVESHC